MKILFSFIIIVQSLTIYGQSNDTLSNESIIKMFSSGLSKELIIKKIQSNKYVKFNLSADELIRLKNKKIPDTLVMIMMDKQEGSGIYASSNEQIVSSNKQTNKKETNITLSTGIYYYNRKIDEYIALPANTSGLYKEKSDILVGMFTKGYIKFDGKTSLLSIEESQPTFYIKLENNTSLIQPSQIVIYYAEVKKGNRIIPWTKGLVVANEKDLSNLIIPKIERIDNTLYKISIDKKLPKGNYFMASKSNPWLNCFEFDILK